MEMMRLTLFESRAAYNQRYIVCVVYRAIRSLVTMLKSPSQEDTEQQLKDQMAAQLEKANMLQRINYQSE